MASNPRAIAAGREAYTGSCAECHGATGDGKGAFGQSTYPAATDLTSHDVVEKSDAELFWITKSGLSFTGMPGFADAYTDQEIWSIVSYLRVLQGGQPAAINVPTPSASQVAEADPRGAAAQRGAAIYFAQNCQACHGPTGNAPGNLALRGGGETGAIRRGRPGMPVYGTDRISDAQLADLEAYLGTFASQRQAAEWRGTQPPTWSAGHRRVRGLTDRWCWMSAPLRNVTPARRWRPAGGCPTLLMSRRSTHPLSTPPPRMPQEGRRLFAERERIERLSRIRQLVFGSLDGLIVPLGVVSGVAGGVGDSRVVIVAGIAEAFAGALSMGAGEFISGRAEAQVQQTEVRKELDEMERAPEYEFNELVEIYERDGVEPDDARLLVGTLARYPTAYKSAMVGKELGIATLEPQTVRIPEALTIGVSYLIGSIFPLLSYFFFPVPIALPISLVLTFIALVIVGIIKGKLASMNLVTSVIEIVIVGAVSAAGGYLLGSLVPHLFGY